jgi:hypothetical protein
MVSVVRRTFQICPCATAGCLPTVYSSNGRFVYITTYKIDTCSSAHCTMLFLDISGVLSGHIALCVLNSYLNMLDSVQSIHISINIRFYLRRQWLCPTHEEGGRRIVAWCRCRQGRCSLQIIQGNDSRCKIGPTIIEVSSVCCKICCYGGGFTSHGSSLFTLFCVRGRITSY